MTFQEYLAEYVVLGRTTSLYRAAEQALVEGLDSPTLRILAGMDDNTNIFEIKSTFKRVLHELNQHLPDHVTAANTLVKHFMKKIVNQQLDPIDGMRIIVGDIMAKTAYPYPAPDKGSFYDNQVFMNLYGLYYTYDDELDIYDGQREDKLAEIKTAIISEAKEYLEQQPST